MLRSERLEPVLDVASDAERRAAEALGAAERAMTEAERKLAELERYEQEYRAALRHKTATGIDASQLRSFHGFIGRLNDAVVQQGAVVNRAREERDTLRDRWLDAMKRARAVGKVIEHAAADERRVRERREQMDYDERAQRAFAAADRARREQALERHPGEEP